MVRVGYVLFGMLQVLNGGVDILLHRLLVDITIYRFSQGEKRSSR